MPNGVPFVAANWGDKLGGAIEGGFDDIMKGLAARKAAQEGDLNFMATTGYNRDNLLKGQAIDAGMRDGSQPLAPGTGGGGYGPAQPASAADQGMWGEYQNFNTAMKSMRDAKMTGLAADARMKTAHADLYESLAQHPKAPPGTLPDNVLKMAEDEALHPGSFPVDLVGGRGADRAAYEAAVRDAAVRHGITYSGGTASAQLGGTRQAAKTPEESGFRIKQATADALLPQLATLRNLSKYVPRDSWQKINELGVDMAAQQGDEHANNLQTQRQQIALNMQSLYPTGSNEKLDIDLKNLSYAKDQKSFDGSIRLIAKDIVNTRNARARVPADTLSAYEKGLDIYPVTEESGATPGSTHTAPPPPTSHGTARMREIRASNPNMTVKQIYQQMHREGTDHE